MGIHRDQGVYIGPGHNHYICIRYYIQKTMEKITDTVIIIPNCIPIPELSIDDHVKATRKN